MIQAEAPEPTKTCPKCGAEVRANAHLCLCSYGFEGPSLSPGLGREMTIA
jgi:hypothetical protein